MTQNNPFPLEDWIQLFAEHGSTDLATHEMRQVSARIPPRTFWAMNVASSYTNVSISQVVRAVLKLWVESFEKKYPDVLKEEDYLRWQRSQPSPTEPFIEEVEEPVIV